MLLTFSVNTLAPVFYKLLYMSLTALAVGAVVLFVRRFADKRISPFWKYAMWALVLAALILPWRPQSGLAVMNSAEKIQEVHFRDEYYHAQSEYHIIRQTENPTPEQTRQIAEVKSKRDTLHLKTLVFDSLLPLLWLCGAVMTGLFMLLGGMRLGRKIKASAVPVETARYENILQRCKRRLGVKRRVQIILQSHVKTPALFGLLRPVVVLPDYAEDLSDAHLEYVVLHELSHLRRGDGLVNTLLLILHAAYWFNPPTWLLFRFIREDMELANDAAILKNMGAEERKEYSLSLVEVLAGCGKHAFAPRLLCMADNEKNIARRIGMIKLGEFFKKRRLVIAVSGLLVIAVTAALFLTAGAKKVGDTPPTETSGAGSRTPGVKVTIEEWHGEADDALEPIYEDAHYKYSLSSIRSDKIMLTFEDGNRLSLKNALAQRKIGMEDLILSGLQVYMEPKNNPLGGSFNATVFNKYTFGESEFSPSDIFMYIYPLSGADRTAAFAYGELAKYVQEFGGAAPQAKPPTDETLTIEGVVYIKESGLRDLGLSAEIGWFSPYSNRIIPVRFTFSDAPSASGAAGKKFPRNAVQISSDRFLSVKKGMSMKEVMNTLGETVYIIGQGPSAMYFTVDGQPLRIDFIDLDDPYPFSGREMKQYFDAYKAVTFRIIPIADVKRLKKGMSPEEIVKTLGNTVDIGSGRHILKYTVWDGLAFIPLTFNSGGGQLPHSAEEIYQLLSGGPVEITW